MDWLNTLFWFAVLVLFGCIYQRVNWMLNRIQKIEEDASAIRRHLDWIEQQCKTERER